MKDASLVSTGKADLFAGYGQFPSILRILLISVISFFATKAYSQTQPCYYLYPYNMHVVAGQTSTEHFVVKDSEGNILEGTLKFGGYNGNLIRINSQGFVTALRTESPDEIGTWVTATFNGVPTCNSAVVRAHSRDYNLHFIEEVKDHVVLFYPERINDIDIKKSVDDYQIALALELAYVSQQKMLNLVPFNGCKQIVEVDIGETATSTVCGIAGNPFRLGWNINGGDWGNCFLVPFIPPRSPQWFVFFHEMGHNFAGECIAFTTGLGGFNYGEGIASILGIIAGEKLIKNSPTNGIQSKAKVALEQELTGLRTRFSTNLNTWRQKGAPFAELDPDIVDGIYLSRRNQSGPEFDQRFFMPLHNRSKDEVASPMSEIARMIWQNGSKGTHNFFAALISFASEQDLSKAFVSNYNYPIDDSLFKEISNQLARIEVTVNANHSRSAFYMKPYSVNLDASHSGGDELLFLDTRSSEFFSISPEGVITGIPQMAGTCFYDFKIHNNKSGQDYNLSYPIVVQVDSCNDCPQFFDSYIVPATVGKNLYTRINCYNKPGTKLKYTLIDGPSWIELHKLGSLSGTPEKPGNYSLRVQVENELSNPTVKEFSLRVIEPNDVVLSIFKETANTFDNQLCVNGIVGSTHGITDGMSFDWGDGCYTRGWFAQTHVYRSPGFYRVIVTAEDSEGNRKETSLTHTVPGYFNHPPKPLQSLNDTLAKLDDGFIDIQLNFKELFYDSDGDSLSVQAFSEHDSIASVNITATGLSINLQSPGRTKIFLKADDGNCGTCQSIFNLSVVQSSNVNYFKADEASLVRIMPNPFNVSTTFEFDLIKSGMVDLFVYDLSGKIISKLIDHELLDQGSHRIIWNGMDERQIFCQPGTYFVKLTTDVYQSTAKFVFIHHP